MSRISRESMQAMQKAAVEYNQGYSLQESAQAAVRDAGISNSEQLANFAQDVLGVCQADTPVAKTLASEIGMATVGEFRELARAISAVAEHLALTMDPQSGSGPLSQTGALE